MFFNCPHCGFKISPKTPKAGKFTPKCPKCQGAFVLVIPEDISSPWSVTPVAANQGPSVESTHVTGAHRAPDSKPKPPVGTAQVTGAFESIETKVPKREAEATRPRPSVGPAVRDDETGPIPSIGTQPASRFEATAMQANPEPPVVDIESTSALPKVTQSARKKVDLEATGVGAARTAADVGGTRLGEDDPSESEDASSPEAEEKPSAIDIPNPLGNYEVIKELGRGGMGAVYLGRQLSLNRPVALKVMNRRWASDPIFVARFTREAYAAAQLVHHNMVQIYDIGTQDEVNFFSMEFVEGRSLGDLVKKNGKLEPEEAVGYVLQAARGLKFAHDRGMIHRDVKPDNLMLNKQGIVKVADLGLVKTPAVTQAEDRLAGPKPPTGPDLAALNAEITDAHTAMGSPAYMSPEQCRDAANVDQRADIYSLGCTLYVMLTGRTPFSGNSAVEVMSKHAYEAVIPPETIVQRVPKEVSSILLKMMAKDPNDRYTDMGSVVKVLENWLGVHSTGAFSPKEEHLESLEAAAAKFNAAPAAKLRDKIVPAFLVGSLALMLILAFVDSMFMIGVFSMVLHAVAAYFVIQGVAARGYLFGKAKQVVFGARLSEWVFPGIAVLFFLGVLVLTEYIWVWVGFGVLGVGAAFLMHFLVDQKLVTQRRPALDEVEHMFKRLRLSGLDEDNLRLFVAKYSGNRWEEFFEALFGFEEKLKARSVVTQGEAGRHREKFATWREPIAKRLDAVLKTRQEAKERAVLKEFERKKLEAEGLSKKEAEEQADAAAEQMVEVAAEIKQADAKLTLGDRLEATMIPGQSASMPTTAMKNKLRNMLAAAEKPVRRGPKIPLNPLKLVTDFVLGWKLRFLLAAALIAGGALWFRIYYLSDLQKATNPDGGLAILKALFSQPRSYPLPGPTIIPEVVRGYFDYINPLVAGLLLLVSLFVRGTTVRSITFLAGAAVIGLGHQFGLPEIGPIKPYVGAMIVGTAIAVVGMVVSRHRGA